MSGRSTANRSRSVNTPGDYSSSRGNSRHSNLASSPRQCRSCTPGESGSLEISLEQVCGELDAAREHVQRLMDEQDYAQSLREEAINFLMSCLADIKKEEYQRIHKMLVTFHRVEEVVSITPMPVTTPTQQLQQAGNIFGGLPSAVSTQGSETATSSWW